MLQRFLAMFGDTFKLPESYESKKEAMAVPVDIAGHGNFSVDVVGESHYRSSIWSCIPSEYSKRDDLRLYFTATLVEEDQNKHDKNAVAIKIRGIVGYLSRPDAKRYRAWRSANNIPKSATCRCVIVSHKNMPDYGVWLDLPF